MFSIQAIRILLVVSCFAYVAGVSAGAFESEERPIIHVGIEDGDIRGKDQQAIQAAIDYVAGLGGGTVHVGPGRYTLRNAVTLRDHVRLIGTPGKTVFVPVVGSTSALAVDGDANQRAITLAEPGNFRIGDRVLIADSHYAAGFDLTSAVLTAKIDHASFRLSEPLHNDYMVHLQARVDHSFPAVGGWNVKNAAVEDVIVEGTRGRTVCKPMDGCRHGGIYLFECAGVTIRRCTVRDFNGDGISFQVSDNVTLDNCVAENNAGLGLHPGSGSGRPVVRGCRSEGNGRDGLYVCWRVQHGRFEDNELRGNKGVGISIGHKDSDNLFRGNRVTLNQGVGLLFRDEDEAMGAHRNLFEKNAFLDNGLSATDESAACILILGHHCDLVFRHNTIGFSSPRSKAAAGICAGKDVLRLQAMDNEFLDVKEAVQTGK